MTDADIDYHQRRKLQNGEKLVASLARSAKVCSALRLFAITFPVLHMNKKVSSSRILLRM